MPSRNMATVSSAVVSMAAFISQPQHRLGDDVALNLRGTAVNGRGTVVQVITQNTARILGPERRRAFAMERVRIVGDAGVTQCIHGSLQDVLVQLRGANL